MSGRTINLQSIARDQYDVRDEGRKLIGRVNGKQNARELAAAPLLRQAVEATNAYWGHWGGCSDCGIRDCPEGEELRKIHIALNIKAEVAAKGHD